MDADRGRLPLLDSVKAIRQQAYRAQAYADYATLGKRPDRDEYQQCLVQVVSSSLGKAACANLAISFHPMQGREICVVRVSASAVPVYFDEGGASRLYVRLASTSRELTGRDMTSNASVITSPRPARFRPPRGRNNRRKRRVPPNVSESRAAWARGGHARARIRSSPVRSRLRG